MAGNDGHELVNPGSVSEKDRSISSHEDANPNEKHVLHNMDREFVDATSSGSGGADEHEPGFLRRLAAGTRDSLVNRRDVLGSQLNQNIVEPIRSQAGRFTEKMSGFQENASNTLGYMTTAAAKAAENPKETVMDLGSSAKDYVKSKAHTGMVGAKDMGKRAMVSATGKMLMFKHIPNIMRKISPTNTTSQSFTEEEQPIVRNLLRLFFLGGGLALLKTNVKGVKDKNMKQLLKEAQVLGLNSSKTLSKEATRLKSKGVSEFKKIKRSMNNTQ